MALALSFLATVYPSWRAATLDSVETLRYERIWIKAKHCGRKQSPQPC